MSSPVHTLHAAQSHSGWDRDLPPVLHVAPGQTVALEVADASGGQIVPGCPADRLARLDPDRVNPTTGPVRVEGARPGDALRVRIDALEPSGWGWTGVIPGFGLLADEFPEPAIHHWSYDPSGARPAAFRDLARVGVRPFPGTIGVAPAAPGPHPVIPPRRVGGNLDTRDLVAGSTLWLPVEVEGALFSLGDTHAAQGDGEVCGTAVESPMTVVVTLDVERGAAPRFPVYETPRMPRGGESTAGTIAATGVGPDLMGCARDAVRGMIDLLTSRIPIDPVDAYMLCSVAADLRVAEVVDAPNWVISCALSTDVLSV